MTTQSNKYVAIATAPTIERLERLLQQFYYSPSVKIEGGTVTNSNGIIGGVSIVQCGKRFRAILTP